MRFAFLPGGLVWGVMSAFCRFALFGEAGSCFFAGDDTDFAFGFALRFGDCFDAALGECGFGLVAFAFVAVGTGTPASLPRGMAINSQFLVRRNVSVSMYLLILLCFFVRSKICLKHANALFQNLRPQNLTCLSSEGHVIKT